MPQKRQPPENKSGDWHTKPLQERPGFLIRRLHQIHVALFMEECAADGITPVQYSILAALDQMGTAEQIVLARAVGLDTTNVADVIARLERQRLLKRRTSPKDKRMKVVSLTETGRNLLLRIDVTGAALRTQASPGRRSAHHAIQFPCAISHGSSKATTSSAARR